MFYLKLTFALVVCVILFYIGKAWLNSRSMNETEEEESDEPVEAPVFETGEVISASLHDDSGVSYEPVGISESKESFVEELEAVNDMPKTKVASQLASQGQQSTIKFDKEFDKDSIIEDVNRAKKNLHPVYNKNVTRDSKGRFISKKK